LDALTHAGPAKLSRISPLTCLSDVMQKVTYADVALADTTLAVLLVRGALVHRKIAAEPALRPYAAG
ncbi:MAG TPA: hypothetical protein VKB54_10545, partial [Solirubrobacteraceae bacterium]|nr:hypothetical protein [Solirubrobacteraceae bacterium]